MKGLLVVRLWHYKMIKFLPKAQLVSQWRECVCIATNITNNGTPNHLLVNAMTEYPITNFNVYCNIVLREMVERGYNVSEDSINKLEETVGFEADVVNWLDMCDIFNGWHNKEYLRVCYANLYEKWKFGKGKSRITDEEWQRLCDGYKKITGEEYTI